MKKQIFNSEFQGDKDKHRIVLKHTCTLTEPIKYIKIEV